MMDFLATNWPILVSAILGTGLIVVEAFMPGFGIPGTAGTLMTLFAVYWTYHEHSLAAAIIVLLICVTVDAVVVTLSLRSAAKGRLSRTGMILHDTESAANGYNAGEDMQVFVGKEGTTLTPLRPTGMADIDGMKLNVMSEGEFLPSGTCVRIASVEGTKIVVKAVKK